MTATLGVSSSVLLLAAALGSAGTASPASAQTCTTDTSCQFLECRSPASGVPAALWGNLAPVDSAQLPAVRDNTDWNEFTDPHNETEPHWMALDIENGWIFAAIEHGMQIWDGRGSLADDPTRVKVIGQSAFPFWRTDPHESEPVRWLDAPPGNDNVVAVAIAGGAGMVVFNTTTKTMPLARYGDRNKTALQVHTAHIGTTDYVFTATTAGTGLLAHNLTAAGNRTSLCTEDTPSQNLCGVYVGRVGTRGNVLYVHGTGNASATNHWVAMSSGGTAFGLEIWDVSNPGSPQLEISGLPTEFINGVAMWRSGSSYFLAMRVTPLTGGNTQARIYNVSCIAGPGTCTGLGSPVWSQTLVAPIADRFFVTASESGARRFLHFGTVECPGTLQAEWLFDVTTPAQTFDITPPAQVVGGQQTGYWGWYYRKNPTGFNKTRPQMGRFAGSYFYRAAWSLFDIHLLQNPTAPSIGAVSVGATSALPCQQVSFTATGLSGNPAPTLGWEVRDAGNVVVTTGGNVNPFVWTIASNTPAGNYTARATATNGLGSVSASSAPVAVAALPPLAFSGPPTFDPFSGPTVEFHIAAQGATEWNWDFGDGNSTGWIGNPTTGPNPVHTYEETGQYTVRVSIRNCNQAAIESAPAVVEVVSLSILSIETFGLSGCPFSFCAYEACTPVPFTIEVTGDPDFYDYDWDADGSYDLTSTFPVTTHTYYTPGAVVPVLRLRRLAESVSSPLNRTITVLAPLGSQPAAPSGLGASAQSSASVGLSWQDNASNESEYQVEVTREGLFQGIVGAPPNASGVAVAGLDPETGYSFRVRANSTSLGCSSPWAGPAAATTLPAVTLFEDGFESGDLAAWSQVEP